MNASAEKGFTPNNLFSGPPKGVIIFDSYNNKYFPFRDTIMDDQNFNYRNIWSEYVKKYAATSNPLFFLSHYVVENIGRYPQILATRPIMYKSLFPRYEDFIAIMLVGNSQNDVYSPRYYRMLADIAMNSMHYIPGWRVNLEIHKNVILHNLGQGFIPGLLDKYLR
jgi:hypothetical protein